MSIKVGARRSGFYLIILLLLKNIMHFYFIFKDFLFLTTTADIFFWLHIDLDIRAGETFSFV